MKTLICCALCAAIALGGASAFADDDFGIESASPTTITDPVNPQPGMLFNAYGADKKSAKAEPWLKDSHSKLPSVAAMKTGVDKSEKFSLDVASGVNALSVRWEGFIKCKRAGAYTFLFQKKAFRQFQDGYSVRINGRNVIPAAYGEASCDANLKVGWNKIEIVAVFRVKDPLSVSFKPKGSVAEPRPITPKDLFHDEKPEDEW